MFMEDPPPVEYQSRYEQPIWYRGYRGKYHMQRMNWVSSGRAICGADISKPAFFCYNNELDKDVVKNRICKKCLRIVGVNRAKGNRENAVQVRRAER